MPSVGVLNNGGLGRIAYHLECLGCFESGMGQECPASLGYVSNTPNCARLRGSSPRARLEPPALAACRHHLLLLAARMI